MRGVEDAAPYAGIYGFLSQRRALRATDHQLAPQRRESQMQGQAMLARAFDLPWDHPMKRKQHKHRISGIGIKEKNMEYRKYGDTIYIRMDRGDEIIGGILEVCRREQIASALFSGIGGCSRAELQTFLPESGRFETETLSGMLELVSLNGNVVTDEAGQYYHHTHGAFSYKDGRSHRMAAGHMKSVTVLYTAEIELRPVRGGAIHRKYDPETGTGFWSFAP